MQSAIYKKQNQQSNLWLEQNLTPARTASIMSMLEQMVETRSWKVTRGLIEDGKCRLCREQKETVEHLLAGCKKIANSEYLTRHNRAPLNGDGSCMGERIPPGKERRKMV